MWRRGPLALWIALCCSSVSGAADSFAIRSAGAVAGIEVHYFLSGAFGGYGSFLIAPDKDGTYRIPLERDGKPAKDLKAILYAQGCQFDILSVDLLSNPTRSATFECRQLPTISLRGWISPRPPSLEALDVEVRYLASWDRKFFGYRDGPVVTFVVGNAPVDDEGGFQVQIPDFSKDDITGQMKDACLYVRVLEHSTGNSVEQVLPPPDLQCDGIGLKILPSYGFEIAFRERR